MDMCTDIINHPEQNVKQRPSRSVVKVKYKIETIKYFLCVCVFCNITKIDLAI